MLAVTVLDFNSARPLAEILAQQARAEVDAEDVKRRLAGRVREFVSWLFSGRALLGRREARIGDVDGTPGASLAIALTGPDAGLWKDHATGEGGDLIDLYLAYRGWDRKHFQVALKELAAEFLGDPVEVQRAPWQPSATGWIAERRAKLGTKPRQDHLELGAPVATWKYRDLAGNIVASVERYEPDGTPASKTYRPWCFKVVDGQRRWVKGAPELRPLYNLAGIAAAETVVLVEGEKCAQALIDLGIAATTAMQGAEAPVAATDWSILQGKTVIVWPDNDPPGLKYAETASGRLTALGCTVLAVPIPAGKPPKWDAADCIAEGEDAREMIARAVVVPAPARPRIRILDIDELENLPPPTWLVENVVTESGFSILWGRSGALKSWVALDIAMAVACGAPWHGRAVKPGLVVYLAAEGAHGLGSRAYAWRRLKAGDSRPRFKLIPHSVALPGDDLAPLIEAVLGLEERPRLIVLDTLARTFGRGDENKQADMNAYVDAADTLRAETGAHVMVIHHSGVHEDKRERGSNVLRGAADTVIKVHRHDDKIDLINRAPEGKQKDAEEFDTVRLRTQKVHFEHRGSERSTLLLMTDDDPTETPRDRDNHKLGRVEKAIVEAMTQAGEPIGLTRLKLMTKANPGSISRALENLEEHGFVVRTDQDGQRAKLWRLA